MRIIIDLKKSLEENASEYFQKSKEIKKKLERAKLAYNETEKKLALLKENIKKESEKSRLKQRKREWYERFRWFITSSGILVIGGRDATTNEIIIKKHTNQNDLVFHAEYSGSPFVVLKCEKEPDEKSIYEAAQFTACYSKAWKSGWANADIFYVKPNQVTKETKAGEYISKGSFMIYGKKNFLNVPLKLWIGIMEDGKVMAGPEEAIKKHCNKYIEILQGNDKISNIAKKIMQKFNFHDLDEIIRVIPQGSSLK